MAELIRKGYSIFAYVTGISGDLRQYQEYGIWVLWGIGILSCFLGFKVYRFFFSVSIFAFVAIVSCLGLEGHADWGAIVTCFAVLGTIMAFLGYYWYRLGAVVICAMAGGAIFWLFVPSMFFVVIGIALAVIGVLFFPVVSVCLFTSISGGLVLAELGIGWKAMILTVAGFLLQLRISRNQKLFKKACPDRITHWLEKRRRK